jgi:hypothetical protein
VRQALSTPAKKTEKVRGKWQLEVRMIDSVRTV